LILVVGTAKAQDTVGMIITVSGNLIAEGNIHTP
jgi:hypothetical protein